MSQIFQVFQPLKIVKAILKVKGHTKTHEFGQRTSWLTQLGELGTRGTVIRKPQATDQWFDEKWKSRALEM